MDQQELGSISNPPAFCPLRNSHWRTHPDFPRCERNRAQPCAAEFKRTAGCADAGLKGAGSFFELFDVLLAALDDRTDVVTCGRKPNLFYEGRTVRDRRALHPLQYVPAARVIIGEGVRQWIVGALISAEQFAQVPGPALNVGCRVRERELSARHSLFARPLEAGVLHDLHQTSFTFRTTRGRIKSALLP